MKLRLGKKAMEIPIHWLIIFVVFLIVLIVIAISAFNKQEGMLANLFSSLKGGG
jgi:hypothetical protein